jgi:hypothetical protein
MFAVAHDYEEACTRFKMMLGKSLLNSSNRFLLDELIEIARLDDEGKEDDMESNLEFTDVWLRELGLDFDIVIKRG